jgi:hypothetical protein
MANDLIPPAAGAYPDFDPRLSPLAIALMERRLGELRRLSTLALERIRHLELALEDRMDERERKLLIGRGGISVEFPRALRCFRQVAALELELLGLRAAPDRSEPTEADADGDRDEPDNERPDLNDLNDLNEPDDRPETHRQLLADTKDYRKGPLDIVVAEIRQVLGVEPPEDDPFAPPPGRRAAKPRAKAEKIAKPAAPEHAAPAKNAAPARQRPAKPAHPHPPFVIAPAKPRRAVARLLSGTARNRGPPH